MFVELIIAIGKESYLYWIGIYFYTKEGSNRRI